MPDRPASPGQDIAGKTLNYRNGFRVPVAGNAIGGVRELAGNSAALINGMNALHTEYEAAPEASQGKIPVVKMIGAEAVKAGQATNYQPIFQIQSWVERPDVLGARTVAPPGQAPRAVQSAPATERRAAPAHQQAAPQSRERQPAMADEMPF